MNSRASNILWWLLLAVICLGAIAWRALCPPTADDFFYRLIMSPTGITVDHITSWTDVFTSIANHHVNGRFANLLAYVVLFLPRWLEVAVCGALVAALPLLSYLLAGGSMAKKNTSLLALCALATWVFCPWHDMMQSTDYLLNYVFSMDAVLLAMLLWRRPQTWQGRNWMWFCPLLVVCCVNHEAATGVFIAWAGLETLFNWRGPFPWKKALGWLCAVGGLMLILSSPAVPGRIQDVQVLTNKFSKYILFGALVALVYFAAAVIFALLPAKRLKEPKRQLLTSQLPVLMAVILSLIAIVNMTAGPRVLFMPNVLAIIGLMMLIESLKSTKWQSPYVAATLILLLGGFYASLMRWTYFCREDYGRVQAEVRRTGSPLVFMDIHSKDDMPIWTLKIPFIQRYYESIAELEGFYTVAKPFHSIAVLPKAWEGKPREQWTTLPGLSDFYQLPGEGAVLSTRWIFPLEIDVEYTDSIVADNALYRLKRWACKATNKGNKAKIRYNHPDFLEIYQGDSIFVYYQCGTSQFFEGRVLKHCEINESAKP